MSKVLFLSIPSHGHVNLTVGLADHFSSEEFREAGGYKKAVAEIFVLKKRKGIISL